MAVTLSTPAAWSLSGRVLDPEGQPLAGAEVRAYAVAAPASGERPTRLVRADGAGRFELSGIRLPLLLQAAQVGQVGSRLWLQATPEAADAEPLPERLAELDLHLYPERTVQVVVASHAGTPLQGAQLQFHSAEAMSPARFATSRPWLQALGPVAEQAVTGADGRVAISGLAQVGYRVTVIHPEHQPWSQLLAPEARRLEVRLQRGLEVHGTVLGQDGAALAGATLVLQTEGPFQYQTARSSDHGVYRFPSLAPAERAAIWVSAPGHAPQRRVLDASGGGAIDWHLAPGLALAGQVADAAGAPAAHAHLELQCAAPSAGTDFPLLFQPPVAEADAQGQFAFEHLPPGRYRVFAEYPAEPGRRTVVWATAGGPPVTIRLGCSDAGLAALRGLVRDGLDGTPVYDFVASLEREESAAPAVRLHYERDRFRADDLPQGRWVVRVRAHGYAEWRSEPLELGAGEETVFVDLLPWRNLHAVVLDANQRPVARAAVRVRDRGGRWASIRAGEGGHWVNVLRTDAAGRAELLDVPGGPVTVQVQPPFLDQVREFHCDLTFPPAGAVEFTLPWELTGARRSLELTLYSGPAAEIWNGPPPRAAQYLEQPVQVVATDAEGELAVECSLAPEASAWSWSAGAVSGRADVPRVNLPLPQGACRLRVSARGHAPRELEIPAGTLDLALTLSLPPL